MLSPAPAYNGQLCANASADCVARARNPDKGICTMFFLTHIKVRIFLIWDNDTDQPNNPE